MSHRDEICNTPVAGVRIEARRERTREAMEILGMVTLPDGTFRESTEEEKREAGIWMTKT